MNVAVNGDRSTCLTQELAPNAYLFAVARGFGTIDGAPVAAAGVSALRSEFARRTKGARFQRIQKRPKGPATALAHAFARVNTALHARSASHDDFVTLGCSMTGVLLLGNRAYLAHAGSTAAYLTRNGLAVALTKNDAFEDCPVPVLVRSLGSAPVAEISVSSFAMNEGDALVLAGHTLADPLAQSDDQMLVVHYEAQLEQTPCEALMTVGRSSALLTVLATLLFYGMLCIK